MVFHKDRRFPPEEFIELLSEFTICYKPFCYHSGCIDRKRSILFLNYHDDLNENINTIIHEVFHIYLTERLGIVFPTEELEENFIEKGVEKYKESYPNIESNIFNHIKKNLSEIIFIS